MSSQDRLSRRSFLRWSALGTSAALLAACAPQVVRETVVVEKEVEKEVTKVVEKEVEKEVTRVVEAPPAAAMTPEEILIATNNMPGSPNHPSGKGWKTTLPDLPPAFPVTPPVALTSSRRVDSSMRFAEGDTIDNSPFTRMARDLFGIIWKPAWTWATAEDGLQKLNLAMASGDLPDMLETVPLTIYVKMLEADLLLDITDAWETHASDRWLNQPMEYGGGLAWAYAEVNGRRMGIPYVERAAQNDKVLWIREDWLEKVGKDIPTTVDEVAEVALAFKQAGLGAGAAGTTTGLLASRDLVSWYGSLDPVIGSFGILPGYWTPDGEGGILTGSVRPEMKDALALLRQWYADGVIEPDYFTLPVADGAKLVGGNRCGMHFSPDFGAGFGGIDSIRNDPSARWIFVDVPVGATGKKGKHWSNPFPSTLYAFRKGFQHVDLVIQQTNWLAELWGDPANRYHGWEGKDYVWVDDTVEGTGAGSTKHFYGPVGTNGNPHPDPLRVYNNNLMVENEWSKIPPEQRDAMQQLALEDPTGVAQLGRQANLFLVPRSEEDGIKNLFTTLPTPTMVERGTDLQDLQDAEFVAIITGQKPVDAFDAFVRNWRSLGGDQVIQEVNEWWKSRQ